jgi:CheY-like chemotaxis protein
MGEYRCMEEVQTMSRILFADSEPHIRRLFLEELREEGYEVVVAGNGAGVVRLMEAFEPDVVIMEVLLPDMSGVETGRIVKGTRRDTRVIFHSHCIPPQDLGSLGADAFVVKSHDLGRLKEAVRRLLPSQAA